MLRPTDQGQFGTTVGCAEHARIRPRMFSSSRPTRAYQTDRRTSPNFFSPCRTIIYSSIVHTVGNLAVALASTPWISSSRFCTFVGLILVATGAGLMKPCISTLGGEQFVLPQQAKQMATFFSVFYFSINVGSLLASILAPILRQDVKCLGQPSCYPLAFGVPAFLMFLALVLFVCGKPWYRMKEPEGNILVEAMKCIFYALRKKLSYSKLAENPSYWLNYATDKFDQRLLKDTREMIRLLPMFIPVPLYWALSDQQGSSWIFQASQMDGVVPNWFTIKPDQLGFLNPLCVVILIPIFEIIVYPMLGKIGVKRPLQYITIGALTCAFAFLMSSYVEYRLEPSYAKLPAPGLGQLRIFNGLPCQVELDPPIRGRYLIPPLGALQWTDIQVNGTRSLQEKPVLNLGLPCNDTHMPLNWTEEILLFEERGSSYILGVSGEVAGIKRVPGFDDVSKSLANAPRLRVIHNLDGPLTLTNQYEDTFKFQLMTSQLATPMSEIATGRYQIMFESKNILSDLLIESGGVYTLVLQKVHSKIVGNLHTITPPVQLHILWMVPQIVVIAISEIFFSVTYISFTFTEAPVRMRSIMSSISLLAISLGNVIVVFISSAKLFNRQVYRFLFYAGLMVLNTAFYSFSCPSDTSTEISRNQKKQSHRKLSSQQIRRIRLDLTLLMIKRET